MTGVAEFIIEKRGDEWVLISRRTGRVLGRHKRREDAEKQERLIRERQRNMADDTYTLRNVEIMRTGKANGEEITERDLEDIVSAFGELDFKPPVKSGHVRDKPGMPALGWIERLTKRGKSLYADIVDIPRQVYDAIRARRYDTVSAEVFYGLERNGKRYRRALKALALLGADIPAIAGLKPLHEMFDAEHHDVHTIDAVFEFSTEDDTMSDNDQSKNTQQHAGDNAREQIDALKREIKELSEKLTAKTLENEQLRKQDEEEKKRLEQKLFAIEEEARKAKIESKIKEVKVPALRPYMQVCYELAMGATDKTVEFSIGDKTENLSPEGIMDHMVQYINTQAEKLFTEHSTGNQTGSCETYDTVGDEVDAKVREFCQKNSKDYVRDYPEALRAVLAADPDLKRRYNEMTQ